jgi:hypothetical protein
MALRLSSVDPTLAGLIPSCPLDSQFSHMDASPFLEVFRTNYAPSPEEVTQIRRYVSTPLETLRRVEVEISRLRFYQDQLKDVVDPHLALLSPIRRVPIELLQQIFLFCLPEDRNVCMHASEAPLLLGRVCMRWREIVRETPGMWRSLHVVVPPSYEGDTLHEERREAVKIWLARSGHLPIRVSLRLFRHKDAWGNAGGKTKDMTASQVRPFFLAILPFYSRLEMLSIDGPNYAYRELSPALFNLSELPNLKRLRVIEGGDYWSDEILMPSTTHLIKSVPLEELVIQHDRLRSFDLDFPRLKLRKINIALSVCNLFRYQDDIYHLIASAPLLRVCELVFWSVDPSVNINQVNLSTMQNVIMPVKMVHQNLETLTMHSRHPWLMGSDQFLLSIFSNLICPSLHTLSISLTGAEPSMPSLFLNFMERSNYPLRKLECRLSQRTAIERLIGMLEYSCDYVSCGGVGGNGRGIQELLVYANGTNYQEFERQSVADVFGDNLLTALTSTSRMSSTYLSKPEGLPILPTLNSLVFAGPFKNSDTPTLTSILLERTNIQNSHSSCEALKKVHTFNFASFMSPCLNPLQISIYYNGTYKGAPPLAEKQKLMYLAALEDAGVEVSVVTAVPFGVGKEWEEGRGPWVGNPVY